MGNISLCDSCVYFDCNIGCCMLNNYGDHYNISCGDYKRIKLNGGLK